MQRFRSVLMQPWFDQLSPWQKELLHISLELYEREERMHSAFSDYSFVLFPAAKAYEGFLKQYLFDLGLISATTYADKRFRIGRALNPDVHPIRRDEWWLYDDVKRLCGADIAAAVWKTWLECRNQVFHYFPHNERRLTLEETAGRLSMVLSTMEQATHCQLKKN
ncbi:hypothetical protein H3C70_01105 [Patescibacteria group bacterium]|mgnify:FL=1|nr:hypothetical protein [Patescibacteria group bacterium]